MMRRMLILVMRIAPRSVALRALVFALGFLALFAWATLPFCLTASAQESPKPPIVSPHARLLAARSIFIEHSGGRIPNDVIGDAFQGWGHYLVVGDPARADLIVSINAPVYDSGVSVGSSGGRGRSGSSSSNTSVSSSNVIQIRLLILDAHDRVVLWSSTEQPKSSLKERQREDNLVDASLRLFRRFRDTIEPEPAP